MKQTLLPHAATYVLPCLCRIEKIELLERKMFQLVERVEAQLHHTAELHSSTVTATTSSTNRDTVPAEVKQAIGRPPVAVEAQPKPAAAAAAVSTAEEHQHQHQHQQLVSVLAGTPGVSVVELHQMLGQLQRMEEKENEIRYGMEINTCT